MNIKNLVLGIGIIIVFALALGYGIEAFYPSPDYEDYCGDVRPVEIIQNAQACEDAGGQWVPYIDEPAKNGIGGYCNPDYTCSKDYEASLDGYSWWVFLICMIVGIIALIIGYSILSIEPVGSALMSSGIWSFFYGGIINWRNFGEIWRFVLLFLVLVILIWFAWKINSPKKKNWMFWKK